MSAVEAPPASPRRPAPPARRRVAELAVRLRDRRPSALQVALALLVLVGASLLLRSTALHARYWIDEGLSVGISSHPFLDIPGLLRQDGSPPLYYLVLHVWIELFGPGEARTHVLSLGFALAAIPLAFLLARALFGTRAGWVAALLAALNPYLTYYAQETRMYTLVALLGLVASAAFALAFAQRRRGFLPIFAIALTLLLYAHNWGAFLALGTLVALAVLWRTAPAPDRRALVRDALIGYGAVVVLYAAWLPTVLFQARNTGAPWAQRPPLEDTVMAVTSLLGGAAPAMAFAIVVGVGIAALVAARRRAADAPAARAAIALLTALVSGILLAWVASQASPAWATRYFAAFLGPLLLLGAGGLSRAGRLGLVGLAIVVVFWISPRTDQLEHKSNAHTTAVLVRDRLEPDDLVVVTHPEQGPLMHLYLPHELGLRFADPTGFVRDPQIFDWRDALERLKDAKPTPTADALIRTLRPGQHLLLIQPIIRTGRWGAPWTRLVRRRAGQWQRVLDRDPRLSRTLAVPKLAGRPFPRGVRAVLYERF